MGALEFKLPLGGGLGINPTGGSGLSDKTAITTGNPQSRALTTYFATFPLFDTRPFFSAGVSVAEDMELTLINDTTFPTTAAALVSDMNAVLTQAVSTNPTGGPTGQVGPVAIGLMNLGILPGYVQAAGPGGAEALSGSRTNDDRIDFSATASVPSYAKTDRRPGVLTGRRVFVAPLRRAENRSGKSCQHLMPPLAAPQAHENMGLVLPLSPSRCQDPRPRRDAAPDHDQLRSRRRRTLRRRYPGILDHIPVPQGPRTTVGAGPDEQAAPELWQPLSRPSQFGG